LYDYGTFDATSAASLRSGNEASSYKRSLFFSKKERKTKKERKKERERKKEKESRQHKKERKKKMKIFKEKKCYSTNTTTGAYVH
jgi:hypothetical protein